MSGQPQSASSGVKNLRAMFEQNKEDASITSPDRGRSPADSMGGRSNGTSPRPLSKVRTSFVAVGGSGGMLGLVKTTSNESSMAGTRSALSIDEGEEASKRKQSLAVDVDARKNSTAISETIPETAIETPKESSRPGLTERTSYINGKRAGKEETKEQSAPKPAEVTSSELQPKKSKSGPEDPQTSSKASVTTTSKNLKDSPMKSTNGHTSHSTTSHAKTKDKVEEVKASPRPAPIATSKSSTINSLGTKSSKSDPKTPTTPVAAKMAASSKTAAVSKPKEVGKSLAQKPAEKAQPPVAAAVKTTRPSTAVSTNTSASKKPSTESAPSAFHKPKPKSPTKPARLPASLMAQTASSSSKVNSGASAPPARHLTPSAGSRTQQSKPLSRSPSRTSVVSETGQKKIKPTTSSGATRSSIGHDRPALGRPPNSTLKKQPSRQSLPKPTDDSFLARMMRPTTSSASKVLDKIVTPPRSKSTTRPQTRDGAGSHAESEQATGSPVSKKMPIRTKVPTIEEPEATPDVVEEETKPEPTPRPAPTAEVPKSFREIVTPFRVVQKPAVDKSAPVQRENVEDTAEEIVDEEPISEVEEEHLPTIVEVETPLKSESDADGPGLEEPKVHVPEVTTKAEPAEQATAAQAEEESVEEAEKTDEERSGEIGLEHDEVLPIESSTDEKPSEEEPAKEKPSEVKPAEEKPAEEKLAEVRPAEVKPAEVKPAEVESEKTEVVSKKSSKEEPVTEVTLPETEPKNVLVEPEEETEALSKSAVSKTEEPEWKPKNLDVETADTDVD